MSSKKILTLTIFCLFGNFIFSQSISPSTVQQMYSFQPGDSFYYAYSSFMNYSYDCIYSDAYNYLVTIEAASAIGYDTVIDTLLYRYSAIGMNCQVGVTVCESGSDCNSINGQSIGQPFYLDIGLLWNGVNGDDSTLITFNLDSPLMMQECGGFPQTVDNYVINGFNGHKTCKDSCINGTCIQGAETTIFADSIGIVSANLYQIYDDGVQNDTITLLWYHKAYGEEWGTKPQFPTSINKTLSQDEIHVFPNPATDILTLKLANQPEPETYFQLYEATGKLVYKLKLGSSTTSIPCHQLSPGIYIWQITSASQQTAQGKIVVSNQ